MKNHKPSKFGPPLKNLQQRLTTMQSIKLFYISAGLCLLSVILLATALWTQHNTPRLTSAAESLKGYAVATPITQGLVTMQVAKVSFSNGQSHFVAPANEHYVFVDFVVKNNSDHPINVLPSSDTYIKDSAGTVSVLTPYNLTQPFHAGALLPGEQIKGQLSYLAAKTGSLKLFVDSIWSGGVVPFKVQ
jgi:hypothetical protein